MQVQVPHLYVVEFSQTVYISFESDYQIITYRRRFFITVIRPIFRTSSVLFPSIDELSDNGTTSTDAYEILARTFGLDYEESAREQKKKLYSRQKGIELNYPITYNVAKTATLLIYLTVRIYHPEAVLETGVANGLSSYYILNALNGNNKGTLISVEIDSNESGLLGDLNKHR